MADALNKQTFEALVRQYGPELHHYCMGLVGGQRSLADDILQYTFEVAWKRRSDFQGGNARAWLYAIMRRQGLYRLRQERRLVGVTPAVLQRLVGSTQLELPQVEASEAKQLNLCFSELNGVDKTIIQSVYGLRAMPDALKKSDSPTYQEVGNLLVLEGGGNWSADRVRMRLKRALAKLLLCMGNPRGEDK